MTPSRVAPLQISTKLPTHSSEVWLCVARKKRMTKNQLASDDLQFVESLLAKRKTKKYVWDLRLEACNLEIRKNCKFQMLSLWYSIDHIFHADDNLKHHFWAIVLDWLTDMAPPKTQTGLSFDYFNSLRWYYNVDFYQNCEISSKNGQKSQLRNSFLW
jgi:hypothetical protein